jgi:hypothetical protein
MGLGISGKKSTSKINDEISNASVRCSAPGVFSKNFEGKASHINFARFQTNAGRADPW